MAIALNREEQTALKMRAGVGLASLFVVGCFCAAILMSSTESRATEGKAAPTHLAESTAAR